MTRVYSLKLTTNVLGGETAPDSDRKHLRCSTPAQNASCDVTSVVDHSGHGTPRLISQEFEFSVKKLSECSTSCFETYGLCKQLSQELTTKF